MAENPWLVYIEAEEIARKSTLPRSIKHMYYVHRFTKDKKCKDCVHLVINSGNTRSYYKCEVYGITNGAATDWRLSWDACGIFKEKEKEP